jgi:hypothetical protein
MLPIDIGYVPRKGRGKRWLALSGVDSLLAEVQLPVSRDPDGNQWGSWMIEQIAGVLGRKPAEVPKSKFDFSTVEPPIHWHPTMPPGAGEILRNRIACEKLQKEQGDRFLKDMLAGKPVDWSYNFDNVSDLFAGKLRNKK